MNGLETQQATQFMNRVQFEIEGAGNHLPMVAYWAGLYSFDRNKQVAIQLAYQDVSLKLDPTLTEDGANSNFNRSIGYVMALLDAGMSANDQNKIKADAINYLERNMPFLLELVKRYESA